MAQAKRLWRPLSAQWEPSRLAPAPAESVKLEVARCRVFLAVEDDGNVLGKKGCRSSAEMKWPFLTTHDLSTIKTPSQVSAIVRPRAFLSEQTTSADVEAWMERKQF